VKLFLWKLSQDENNDYETYDSAVVVSDSREAASKIHPAGPMVDSDRLEWNGIVWTWGDGGQSFGMDNWAEPSKVKVVLLGEVTQGLFKEGDVICSSYNAG
jgi:hypothetical protein